VGPEDRYIRPEWIKKGAYLANLSVNDYTMDAVGVCDMIVVDHKKQLEIPTTLLADAIEDGVVAAADIIEFGAVVTGRQPGRGNEAQRILFSPLGMGIEDLINAHRIYHEALRRGIGQELELWHEPYWT
jgi:ornithine cyclodeaminase